MLLLQLRMRIKSERQQHHRPVPGSVQTSRVFPLCRRYLSPSFRALFALASVSTPRSLLAVNFARLDLWCLQQPLSGLDHRRGA